MQITATFTSCSVVVAVMLRCVVVICDSPASLKLERAFSHNDQMELTQLRDRDTFRHHRLLQQEQHHSSKDVIDFPVKGTYDPYTVGLYYTKVQLGSPPKEYYVQVDTGSDVLWVSCKDCKGCPTSSGLKVPIVFFDPSSSSTSSLISSSDKRCSIGIESDEADSKKNQCSYTFKYGDGSSTSGYYVSDLIHLNMMSNNTNVSSQVMFGCSTAQTGELSRPERAVDGIFGLGQQGLSVISQLASQGAAPDAFSHCLVGDGDGGGILVLGQIMDQNMVYSPLVSSEPHYSLELQSISVNNKTLKIDPSVFKSKHNRKGTIIDSGTTLGYLAEQAYDPFVEAITNSVPQNVLPVESKGYHCYITKNSVSEMFPSVSLNFAGDASMVLKPENYLLKQKTVDGGSAWCIAFQKVKGLGVTILGDIILKDKSVVYDLGGQRIGWVDHDCKKPVNVSTKSSGRKRISDASPLQNARYLLTPFLILTSMLHISILSSFFLVTL